MRKGIIEKIQNVLSYIGKHIDNYQNIQEDSAFVIDKDIQELDKKIQEQIMKKTQKKICPACQKEELIYDSERGYICLYCEEQEQKGEIRDIDTGIIYDPLVEDYSVKRIRT